MYRMCFKPSSTMKLFIFLLVLLPFIDGRNLNDILDVEKLNCDSEELRYEGQSLSVLHGNIYSHCTNLTALHLKRNNIKIVEVYAFKNLFYLKQLDLSYNDITTLPTGIFSDTEKLESINLLKNRITSLQTKLFANLPYLRSVNFQHNNIRYIKEYCFVNVPNLGELNLANNDLQTLQFNIIDDASSLKTMHLFGNPWNCGLDLCEFMHTVVTRFWQEQFEPYCHSPDEIWGSTFKQVIETPLLTLDSNVRDNPKAKHVVLLCQTCSKTSLSWQFEQLGKFQDLTNKAIQTSKEYFTASILTVPDFSLYDSGNYTCYARNCPTCQGSSWIYLFTSSTTKSSSFSYLKLIGWAVLVIIALVILYKFRMYVLGCCLLGGDMD